MDKKQFIFLWNSNQEHDVTGKQLAQYANTYMECQLGNVRHIKVFATKLDLNKEQLEHFANKALQDTIIQHVATRITDIDLPYESYIFIGKKPGVTDDEGNSAQKTLIDLFGIDIPNNQQVVFSAELYLCQNKQSEQLLQKVANEFLANPLINHIEVGYSCHALDYFPEVKIQANQNVEEINIFLEDQALQKLSKEMVLSLDIGEWHAIQDYYNLETTKKHRETIGLPPSPTDCELEVLAQTWSEHCKHKEFRALIEVEDHEGNQTYTIDSLFKTYIQKATQIVQERLQTNPRNWLVKVFNDNAGVVRIDENRLFVWKVETHNTPSALDPYGGAITGILGNNRDPLGTGRGGGRLLFNTNVLCFGPPGYDKPLLTGQLHPKLVFSGVRHGIEDGGNKSGVPTVNGSIVFDDRYAGKPLVFCGTGSILPNDYLGKQSWEKEIDPGDIIVMAGGRVGKDGIHGATFSSIEIDKYSPATAVQIGSPITQKLLSDFLEVATKQGLVKCTTDNGAGGLSSSIGELATISGGAQVDTRQVPLKYPGLNPWEIFISESQERMTLVIEPKNIKQLYQLADTYEVELSNVGVFTDDGYLNVFHGDTIIASLDLAFLHDGVPRKQMKAIWNPKQHKEPQLPETLPFEQLLINLMADINICSRENVIRQYDHEVKGKTIIKPLMGAQGKSPQDAAVMRFGFNDYQGIAISNGIIPRYGDINAYHMSAGAFDEAVRQIIAVGGRLPDLQDVNGPFWSVNDNFCVPDSAFHETENPDGKQKLGNLVKMCEALYDMSTAYNIPMTSGKDSMKNDFKRDGIKISVPPTILYSMTAYVNDVRNTVTSEFKANDDLIYLVGHTYDELGASIFYQYYNAIGNNVPVVRKEAAKQRYLNMAYAHSKQIIQSCHDISDGGLAVALTECCLGTQFGLQVHVHAGLNIDEHTHDVKKKAVALFSESHSRFVVSIAPQDKQIFEDIFHDDAHLLGTVTGAQEIIMRFHDETIVQMPCEQLQDAWDRGLEGQL